MGRHLRCLWVPSPGAFSRRRTKHLVEDPKMVGSFIILGFGIFFPVRDFMALQASGPEILIIATPDTPGPDERA